MVIANIGNADVITKANFHPLKLNSIIYFIYPTMKPLTNAAIEKVKVIVFSPIASDIEDISLLIF